MSERHFIVYERDNAWNHTHKGSVAGPFKTWDQAVAAAIEEARETGDPDITVIVQDHDMQEETVWRRSAE